MQKFLNFSVALGIVAAVILSIGILPSSAAPATNGLEMGGTVWQDTDGNGLQAGEPGIPNVTLPLHDATTGNAVTCTRAGTTNLALGKTATQVTTHNNDETTFGAGNAVDGDYDVRSVTTNNVAEAWWQVDLGASAPIRQVVIHSSTNGAQVETQNIYVFVSNAPVPNNNQGPGFGEFYWDNYRDNFVHTELALGALAVKKGSGQVVMTAMDPWDTYSAGVRYMKNNDGNMDHVATIFRSKTVTDPGFFGKASSLGDVEILTEPLTALEIGNRVWSDTDRDGIQDATEPGFGGITVELYQGGRAGGYDDDRNGR